MPSTIADVFGAILVDSDIEEAVTATLKRWFPTYLAEIARQQNISPNLVPKPANDAYTTRNSFDVEKGEKIPKVVVLSPGMLGTPTKTGESYRGVWSVGVAVAAAAKTEELATMMVRCYGAAVVKILTDKQKLDGSISVVNIVWTGASNDDLPIPSPHMLYKAASRLFSIDVENIYRLTGGPAEPTLTAPAAYPTVPDIAHVHIGISVVDDIDDL